MGTNDPSMHKAASWHLSNMILHQLRQPQKAHLQVTSSPSEKVQNMHCLLCNDYLFPSTNK
jgi:hypothetical protein